MTRILERVGKQTTCPKCSVVIKYSWLSYLNKDLISLYSTKGDTVLVSEDLRKLSDNADLPELKLENSVLEYQEQRGLTESYGFALRNELKCPNCSFALTSRSKNTYENIISTRTIYLDGMTFINDNGIYKVKIKNKE